ncbi:MAG: dynamin family protein [Pseudomonadota bacterium]
MRDQKKIGEAHQGAVAKLLEAFATARSISPTALQSRLDGDVRRLHEWRARIAVVGQVKAGKSTLLSALIGKPGFLPSEVNPWTSVITRLHFGHPDDPSEGGVFHFFDENAWTRIINGDEKTRRMAEDMLPGFRSDILAEQVLEMQTMAQKRLGRFYNVLLGGEHRYDAITADVLERYVCAGPEGPNTRPADTIGRYSDVTESADIYFPPGPFAAPAVISDTPGVNDPFLVRDEYTCRTFSESDIFIVALSAHQALTEVDIALVRMLAEQDSNEIIIFVNRIDELERLDVAAPRIVEDVRRRVAQAIPTKIVRIVAGSAHWAEQALSETPDLALIERLNGSPEISAYLENANAPSDPRARLLAASGVPELLEALSGSVNSGAGLSVRREASRSLISSIDACISILGMKRKRTVASREEAGDESNLANVLRATLDSQIAAAGEVADEVAEIITAAESDIEGVVENATRHIKRDLEGVLAAFTKSAIADIREILEKRDDSISFDLDMLALRSRVEKKMLGSYETACNEVDAFLSDVIKRTKAVAKPFVGDVALDIGVDELPNWQITPVFLSTSRIISTELTSEASWKFWRTSRISPAEGAEKVASLINLETQPSIDNLVSIAYLALTERAATAVQRLSRHALTAIEAIASHVHELERKGANFSQSVASADQRSQAEYQEMLTAIDLGVEALADIRKEIEAQAR